MRLGYKKKVATSVASPLLILTKAATLQRTPAGKEPEVLLQQARSNSGPLSNSPRGPESHQLPWVSLVVCLPQVEPLTGWWMLTTLWQTLSQTHLAKLPLILIYRSCEVINICSSKLNHPWCELSHDMKYFKYFDIECHLLIYSIVLFCNTTVY